MKKKIYQLGLESWQRKLDYIEKALDCDCPVCMTLHCRQWDGLSPSYHAKENCPLANDRKLCMQMGNVLTKICDFRWEIKHIVDEISRLHLKKRL